MSESKWPNVVIISHPVVQERLTVLRDKDTDVEGFRRLVGQVARLMAFEITRDYPTSPRTINTPMETHEGVALARAITLVPILRAGLGMAEGVHQLLPSARMGHIGIFRNEDTLEPTVYFRKLPADIADSDVILIDPMLATAGSLITAIDSLKEAGVDKLKVLCLVAAPEGIEKLNAVHPNTLVFTAAVDRCLNENGYIMPGLGDAGDRIFGTG